jgi:hypothetical protein
MTLLSTVIHSSQADITMAGNIVFVTITDLTTVDVPTGIFTLSSFQPSGTIVASASNVVSVSEMSSFSNTPAGTGALTTIPALPTNFASPTPISTFTPESSNTEQAGNGKLVQSLALAAIILVILLYLFVIIAFILLWVRQKCPKCQSLIGKVRSVFKQSEDTEMATEKDLEGQLNHSDRHSSWPGSPKSNSTVKQRTDSPTDDFEAVPIDVLYPHPVVGRKNTTEILHEAAEIALKSEDARDPFGDNQHMVNEVEGSRGRPYDSPEPGFGSYDNFVNNDNRNVDRSPSENGEEAVQRHPRYDSDGFLRITPPCVLAVNGLVSKVTARRPMIKSGEIVKLVYRRDSQGIWSYLPPLFSPLDVPKVSESSKMAAARPVVLSRTPTDDPLAQPCRTAACAASQKDNSNAIAAKEEYDRLENIRKGPDRIQTVDLDVEPLTLEQEVERVKARIRVLTDN